MEGKLYFTVAGKDRIFQQRQELREKLKKTQGGKGEAADVGGNQWHDNFSFEQLTRDEEMLNSQIREVNEKIRSMVVIEALPTTTDKLRIGHLVEVCINDEDVKTYAVGGYEDSDAGADPPIISYLAPLIKPLMGKEEGYEVKAQVGREMKVLRIERIFLPEPA